jgi:hypothetical protein
MALVFRTRTVAGAVGITDQLVFTRMGQMTSSKLAVRVIGIDVSKDKLDVSDFAAAGT